MTDKKTKIIIIGAGLAGCEAAWQIAERNIQVELYEMKPAKFSPAHNSRNLAEMVCSNSFRSDTVNSAVGLLKEEMRRCNSLIMAAAVHTSVPAGKALAVDRERFSAWVSNRIAEHPLINLTRKEVKDIPDFSENPVILATGPLMSEDIAGSLQKITGENYLAFYDAIAPVIDAESLDMNIVYRKSRWDEDNPGDYLNCPMSREEYERFIDELSNAKTVPLHDFESGKYFEGCLPVEVMCSRGRDTLRFGPMKPVGLYHPETGEKYHAVVQLRAENREGTAYNMVGFQTKLTYSEQERVFRMIPGLEKAEFLRLGSIHRNTFVCAPAILDSSLALKEKPNLFLSGQLSGVEGYVESAAMGLVAGINSARRVKDKPVITPPEDTALGALINHLTNSEPDSFQPSNVNFGLFPPLKNNKGRKIPKKQRGELRAKQALKSLSEWKKEIES